jgi:hypothetical protein
MSFQNRSNGNRNANRDGGRPPRDGGNANRDGGRPPRDGGNGNRDGGRPPRDGGRPPRDGGNRNANRDGQRDGGPRETPKVKTIDVANGSGGSIAIPLTDYIAGINSFNLSQDPLNICNQFGINNQNFWAIASKSSIAFLNALRGTVSGNYIAERNILYTYNIGIEPTCSPHIRQKVAYLKWVIHTNSNNIDNDLAYYIGFVAGICMYFNEKDAEGNIYKTFNKNLENICKSYNAADF